MKINYLLLSIMFFITACNNETNNSVNTNTEKHKVIRTIQIDTIIYSNFGDTNPSSFEFTYPDCVDGYIQSISISYKNPWERYLTYNSDLEQYSYYDLNKNFGRLEVLKSGPYFKVNKTLSTSKDFKLDRDLQFKLFMFVTKWVWE